MISWEAGRMRFDYALYVVAIGCFIIAIYAHLAPLTEVTDLYLYVLAVIGVVFIGLGYMARPKEATLASATIVAPPSPPVSSPEPTVKPKTEPKEELKKVSTKKRARKKRITRKRKKKT